MNSNLALIAACCRWPDGDSRHVAIRSAALQISDWTAFLAMVDAHRTWGLVANGLAAANVHLPAEANQWLAGRGDMLRAMGLSHLRQTLRTSRALGDAGVSHCVLKGVPLGIVAYGSPTIKHSWDVDVLVRPDQAVIAGRALRDFGFAPIAPARSLDEAEIGRWAVASKDIILRSDDGTVLELHWRLSDHPRLLDAISADGVFRQVNVLGGSCVPVLPDARNLAYLAVHGAFHGWSRIKWLADFAAFLGSFDMDRRGALIEQARACNPGRALDQALILASYYFGDSLEPPSPRDPALNRLVDLGRRTIGARAPDRDIDWDKSAQIDIRRSQMLILPSWTYRLRLAFGWIRGSEDRKQIALPGWLAWAYWPLRPFSAVIRTAGRFMRQEGN